MANPEILFLTASIRGKLVGMCEMKYHTAGGGSITRKRQRAYVEAICVDEKYRNRGIGKPEKMWYTIANYRGGLRL